MKETLQFQCHNCSGTFYNRVDLGDKPTLLLECPYCGASCSVNLSMTTDANDTIVILKDGQPLALNTGQSLTDLIIPTTASE
jgi:uncharacterized Zn finger protein